MARNSQNRKLILGIDYLKKIHGEDWHRPRGRTIREIVFGGYGLSKEYHIEKLFRDARAAMIEDGVNETLALGGAARL